MKNFNLIKNPELFQGEKYINKNLNYFEGWYFKNTSNTNNISFIPGISINENEKKSFVQIITNNESYFINYDINDFKFNHSPFYIKIKNNYFSKDKIHIDINEKDIIIFGDIKYFNHINIKNNIMGPFKYIPFMECNHAILSMKNKINGFININNNEINFNNDIGYIEKDFGISFPTSYIWIQGNNFKNKNASFMLSIANIPFKLFTFRGFICSVIIDDKEYRFATYNNSKIIKYEITNNNVHIILKKGKYILDIKSNYNTGHNLIAPVKGKMNKNILESITEIVTLELKENDTTIFYDTSNNCGLEIVN